MKNTIKWFGVIALTAIIGFTMTACGDSPSPPPPPGDSTVENIDVIFGNSAGETEVKVGASPTITYAGGAYTLAYGTAPDHGYGNAIARFKVSLGTAKLSDYGKITFTWTGVSGDVATTYKKLYLLASKDEADLTAWKDDADIAKFVISSNAPNKFYNGDGPEMNGTAATPVEMNFVKGGNLTGDVWFSIYVAADAGSYKIGDLKFVTK